MKTIFIYDLRLMIDDFCRAQMQGKS